MHEAPLYILCGFNMKRLGGTSGWVGERGWSSTDVLSPYSVAVPVGLPFQDAAGAAKPFSGYYVSYIVESKIFLLFKASDSLLAV